jgi:hypothetical protein
MTPGSTKEAGEKHEVGKVFTGLEELIKELHETRVNFDKTLMEAVNQNRSKIEGIANSPESSTLGSIEFFKNTLEQGTGTIRQMQEAKIEEIFEKMCKLVVEKLICFRVSERPKIIEQLSRYGMTNSDLANLQNRILKRLLRCEISLIHAYKY